MHMYVLNISYGRNRNFRCKTLELKRVLHWAYHSSSNGFEDSEAFSSDRTRHTQWNLCHSIDCGIDRNVRMRKAIALGSLNIRFTIRDRKNQEFESWRVQIGPFLVHSSCIFHPSSFHCRASVAQRQSVGRGIQKSRVRNSLVPSGFSLRRGN